MAPQTDLSSFLRSLDAATLADLLYEQAERDPELRKRLLGLAGLEHGDLSEVRERLDDAVHAAESVQLASVLDTLRRLLDAGTRADVVPLARRAVDKITSALDGMDDSTGAVGDQLDRAVSLYARACAAHPPDAAELADWLTALAFDAPGSPRVALAEFAEALGDSGLARIKSTVESVLAESDGANAERRATARRLNQEHAEVTGDVDTVVRMLSEQLPRIDVSLKIVRVLRAAGRHAEAIAHAARALGPEGARGAITATEPGTPNGVAEAAVLTGADENGGTSENGEVPEPAESAESAEPAEPAESVEPGDAAERVRSLLADDDDAAAWKAASADGSSEVIGVYRDHVEALVEGRTPEHYARAARQLRRLRTLYRRTGDADGFAGYLAELVETHRRKTRLLEEIRKARIALPKFVKR